MKWRELYIANYSGVVRQDGRARGDGQRPNTTARTEQDTKFVRKTVLQFPALHRRRLSSVMYSSHGKASLFSGVSANATLSHRSNSLPSPRPLFRWGSLAWRVAKMGILFPRVLNRNVGPGLDYWTSTTVNVARTFLMNTTSAIIWLQFVFPFLF